MVESKQKYKSKPKCLLSNKNAQEKSVKRLVVHLLMGTKRNSKRSWMIETTNQQGKQTGIEKGVV